MRPHWPEALELSRASVPYERLAAVDGRLEGAAARPVIVPETVVVDRGKVFVSEAFVAACETLGVSVQPAPSAKLSWGRAVRRGGPPGGVVTGCGSCFDELEKPA
ncbi:hypothetical protein ACIRL2_43140 [Embleya sp. NPDC127516]|uniref:hypothetical protein n=1 Tax=Embleya sp. NPDC127516 TaxID=3363990 RepID=UPI0037F3D993